MHLEPHNAPTTWAEFFKQYAMIVLSILTALALERTAVALHDRSAARESHTRIEAELAQDTTELRHSQALNRESIAHAKTGLTALVTVLKAPQPDAAKVRMAVQSALTGLSFNTPSWQRQAWDSALADQSVNHLPAADVSRYRAIYATERDFADIVHVVIAGEWLTETTNLDVDLRLDKVDGRQAAHVLARYLLVVEQIETGEETLSESLAGKPAAQARPSELP